jgi:hypothetical protein
MSDGEDEFFQCRMCANWYIVVHGDKFYAEDYCLKCLKYAEIHNLKLENVTSMAVKRKILEYSYPRYCPDPSSSSSEEYVSEEEEEDSR